MWTKLVGTRIEQQEDFWVILGSLPTGKTISLGRYAHKADCLRALSGWIKRLRKGGTYGQD